MVHRIVLRNDLVVQKIFLRFKNIFINSYFDVREENVYSIHEIQFKIANEA